MVVSRQWCSFDVYDGRQLNCGMQKLTPGLVDQVFLSCVEDCLEPMMLTDRGGKLTYVNPAWIATYGYSKEEALGQTPRLLRSNLQDEKFYKDIWISIVDPEVGFWKGELTNRAKDGHLVPVLLTITPYRGPAGEIIGHMGIAMDLTETKKMEQQILHQDRMASVGLLAGGLAHEIGNPLGVIRGRAELALKQVVGNEIAEKNLTIILSQIDRISGLIQALMRVSRSPEKTPLKKVNLQSAVKEVVELTAEECRRSEISVHSRVHECCAVLSDASHLQQLLLNIVINSIHAIEEQKRNYSHSPVQHFIEISAVEKDPNLYVLSVRDSGCGIAKENLNKLFRPFFTTKEAGKGTGLGLAIVAKLVEEVGGKVSVRSDGIGLGACFDIEFQST